MQDQHNSFKPLTGAAVKVWAVALILFAPISQAAILEFAEPIDLPNDPLGAAANVYICDCTVEEWDASTAPTGFRKTLRSESLFSSAINSTPVPAGVAPSITVGGLTANYAATSLTAQLLGFSSRGPMAQAQVQRSTVFTYDAGSTIHEAIDPDGKRSIMFAANIALLENDNINPDNVGAFADFAATALLPGWSYESRTLSEALIIESDNVATVLVAADTHWQEYAAVPIPAAGWLMSMALLSLFGIKRQGQGASRQGCTRL